MTTLVVVSSRPLSAWQAERRSEQLAEHCNPGNMFDRVIVLSPSEQCRRWADGLEVEPCDWGSFARRVSQLEAALVHAQDSLWAADLACLNRAPGVPVIVSVHDARVALLSQHVAAADQIWCASTGIRAAVLGNLGVAEEKVRLCPDGVDTELFRPGPRDRHWEDQMPLGCRWRLVHVAATDPDRDDNSVSVLRALPLLPSAFLVQVGPCDATHLRQLARKIGVADRVFFAEGLEPRYLPWLYNWADCVISVPLETENGRCAVEALACGCAVVTSDYLGVRYDLHDGRDCVLVGEPTNSAAIAEAVSRLLTDETLRTTVLRHAARSVSSLDTRRAAEIKAALYRDLLALLPLPGKISPTDSPPLSSHVGVAYATDGGTRGATDETANELRSLRLALQSLTARQSVLEAQIGTLRQMQLGPAPSAGSPQPSLRPAPVPQLHPSPGALSRLFLTAEALVSRWVRWRRGLRREEDWLMSWQAFAFDRFKRERMAGLGVDLRGFKCPSVPGLVSVVLPAYNGADLIRESIDSVLAQSYRELELIVLADDGSADGTGEVVDSYVGLDPRVKVVHHEHMNLPSALSKGFALARGEFLTWTACDNRMRPDLVSKLVDCLRRHPDWDAVYANMDLIGEDGGFLRDSPFWGGDQDPPGSEHVHLRWDTSELNVRPNNFVGLAFLYRDRVSWLIGGYSSIRFLVEDYDYWMRINELMTLRHADFREPLYEVRFHEKSLTSRQKELRIADCEKRLMVFDDFRRDFALTPMVWLLDGDNSSLRAAAEDRLRHAGHMIAQVGAPAVTRMARWWSGRVYLRLAADSGELSAPLPPLPPNTLTCLVCPVALASAGLGSGAAFDLRIRLGPRAEPVQGEREGASWCAADDLATALRAVDVYARSRQLAQIEQALERPKPPLLKLSAVVCTYRRNERLAHTIESLAHQSLPAASYEVIIVDNAPEAGFDGIVDDLRDRWFGGDSQRLRHVTCPIKGLSHARNAGISEARGEIVYFTDDDAVVEEDCLLEIVRAFDAHPDFGVIGGQILLQKPEPCPAWLCPELEAFWSHFAPPYDQFTEVKRWQDYPWGANWAARRQVLLEIGGFRTRYGRKGRDYGGSEELVASVLAGRLGYKVGVAPRARVIHDVEPDRFTLRSLRRIMRSAEHNMYQAHRDLYVTPFALDFWQVGRNISYHLRCILSRKWRTSIDLLQHWFWLEADLRLAVRQLRDRLDRAREPVCRAK